MDPNGRVAIVTGGASGLGAATVSALIEAGANVAVFDVRPGDENAAVYFQCDITNDDAVERAIALVLERFGRIDMCLNCAGIGGLGAIATAQGPGDMDNFRKVIDVNLLGAVNVTRHAAYHMIRQEPRGPEGERGFILNTVSIASYEGQEGMGPYTAAKAALAALTLVWARDLSRHAIRCMSIAPGFFETPLTSAIPPAMVEQLLANNEFPKRAGRADEFAELAMFVIRNPMLNAEVIRIDGGTRPPARTTWASSE